MRRVGIYLFERIGNSEDVFLLNSYRNNGLCTSSFLFSPTEKLTYNFDVKDKIDDTDFVLVPQPIMDTNQTTSSYLNRVLKCAEEYRKQALLLVGGDFSHHVNFKGFYVLKGTQYKRFIKDNEIIMPPFCEDLGSRYGLIVRQKIIKPVVSFCGWAGFDNKIRYIKYLIRNLYNEIEKAVYFDATREVFKRGTYFRRKALHILKRSDRVDTRFITRSSFSGHAKTIELSPEQARSEYVENMINSDFVLAPKGDANYSVRFFEALSLGRIPILIDTECCLPLEDVIDYSKCILRVPYTDIARIGDIVADFYASLTEEQFAEMQKEARRVFVEYLRYDSFFNLTFARLCESGHLK